MLGLGKLGHQLVLLEGPLDIGQIQLRAIPLDGLLQFPFEHRLLFCPIRPQLPHPGLELPLHFAVCRRIGSEPRLLFLPSCLHIRQVLRELSLHLADLGCVRRQNRLGPAKHFLGRSGISLLGELSLDAVAEVADVTVEATLPDRAAGPTDVSGSLRLHARQVKENECFGQIPFPVAAERLPVVGVCYEPPARIFGPEGLEELGRPVEVLLVEGAPGFQEHSFFVLPVAHLRLLSRQALRARTREGACRHHGDIGSQQGGHGKPRATKIACLNPHFISPSIWLIAFHI